MSQDGPNRTTTCGEIVSIQPIWSLNFFVNFFEKILTRGAKCRYSRTPGELCMGGARHGHIIPRRPKREMGAPCARSCLQQMKDILFSLNELSPMRQRGTHTHNTGQHDTKQQWPEDSSPGGFEVGG